MAAVGVFSASVTQTLHSFVVIREEPHVREKNGFVFLPLGQGLGLT